MTTEDGAIATCPTCDSKYRVPESFGGKSVSCKSCGKPFKVSFNGGQEQANLSDEKTSAQKGVTDISHNDPSLMLGKLAIQYKLISEGQLQEAISIQEARDNDGESPLLGEILLSESMIKQGQLDFLFSVQQLQETREADLHFGVLAVKYQYIKQGHVDGALQEQKRLFKENKLVRSIGDLLIESGALTEQQRNAVLSSQQRLQSNKFAGEIGAKKETVAEQDRVIDLSISDDKLEAHITPRNGIPAKMNIEEIKKYLSSKSVVYGLLTDSAIKAFALDKSLQKEAFLVARGTPPEPCKDDEIKYYFETDPLKVGTIKEGGSIDYKDKGEIPQVEKGVLLAEKIPGEEGMPGTDIYGHPAPSPPPKNIKLRYGKGTELSEDELKIHASAGGRPELSANGKVSVMRELKIPGDLGLATGHVDFDGDIFVAGTVQNGYRVKGGSLSAKEVLRSKVDALGDILVYGGMIGTTANTKGSLRARYIHDAHIEAFGDVVVEKEIIDAKIETSGAVIVRKGSIFSSDIVAKKGIEASQIGSETSKPCILKVGVDDRAKNEIKKTKKAATPKEQELEVLITILEDLEYKSESIHEKVTKLAQAQDAAMVKKRNLEKKIAEIKKANNQDLLLKASKLHEDLEGKIGQGEKVLEKLFNQQDGISEILLKEKEKMKLIEREVKDLQEEINDISEWSQSEEGVPAVKVRSKIFSDSSIRGPHSALNLPESHEKVLIREIKTRAADDSIKYKIKLQKLE